MQIFMIDSRLTTITNLKGASKVLDTITKDNVLIVEYEKGEFVKFSPFSDSTTGEISIRHYNKDSTPFDSISLVYDREDAVRVLYKFRKAFNAKWRD